MRLLIPTFIVLIGMLSGALICLFFNESATSRKISLVAGGVGAFIGMWTRDALDITTGGPLLGALIAAIIGASLCAALVNTFFGNIGR